jgi:hypothetical protein
MDKATIRHGGENMTLAKIKKEELQTIRYLMKTGKNTLLGYYIMKVMAKHGCSPDTHVIGVDGTLYPRSLNKVGEY